MQIDALDLLRVAPASDVGILVDYEASLALLGSAVSEHSPEKAGADYEVIVIFHHILVKLTEVSVLMNFA